MAIIAGMAYCIKSFPIFSVPNAVGVFCPVIPIILRVQRYKKELNKRLKKLERRVADCEAEIEQTEAAISILEDKMATPEGASDMAHYEQHQKLKAQLDSVMEEWDAVSCELEEARK